ncbi:DUF2922 domain-containing protein [Facklamia lactis]|uniref:DUF2922 domain-containing protein n=1 Tax=Facklamia lactis TaxID=2749967 RepID=UPI0018CF6DE7|nr:DUF2922 domain-containing protein [Facklamia lactis]MBG9981040.1 DUF2922 domain-containing protein [Facklamia lactis]
MNPQTVLELQFRDGAGKARKITVKNPSEGLTAPATYEATQAIIGSDLFFSEEGTDLYAEALGARYVTRSKQEIFNAETYQPA